MKKNKFSIFLIRFCVLFFIFTASSLFSLPKVDHSSLRYGYSPRLKRFSWATLSCRIANPDKRPYDVEIRFVDARSGAVSHKTVFADTVTVPPETSIYYNTPVMTESTDEYRLEVFVEGKEQLKKDPFLIRLNPGYYSEVIVLNDSDDVSMGAFVTSPPFKNKYSAANFTSEALLAPWNMLKKVSCIIVVKPDLQKYSAESFRAILDYVYQGGNIAFIDPECVIEAYKTPLAVLLPVTPLRIRKITTLPELTEKYPSFKEFSQPVDFLESVPAKEGVSFIEKDGIPVFRWKKYGLGTCRFSAIPITRSAYKDSETWYNILGFYINHQIIYNDLSEAVPALDEMTGFSVPGIGYVRMIFFIFFLLILIPLVLGRVKKRTGLAWIVSACITVVFSIIILNIAAGSHSKKSGTFLSFIETQIPGVTAAPAEGWYGIFSTSDRKITIKASNSQTCFSAIPPGNDIAAMFAKSGLGKSYVAPTEIKKINGLPEVNNLVLNSNASRQFYATFDSVMIEDINGPEIVYNKDGISFKDWSIPENIKPNSAWLQFASGCLPMQIENGKISLQETSTAGVFSADTTMLSVKDFMLAGWKHSSPMLILVEDSKKNLLQLPKEIIPHGKKIVAVPVRETCAEKLISVPSQSILFSAADSSTRTWIQGNRFKADIVSRGERDGVFRFQLPPIFAALEPQEIVIDFKYLNGGGNVEIKPLLVVGKVVNNKFVPKYFSKQILKTQTKSNKKRKNRRRKTYQKEIVKIKGIEGELENGKYVFKNVQECLKNGTGFFLLDIKIKDKKIPIGEVRRSNKWSFKKMDIMVKGTMPGSDFPANFN